MLNDLEDSPIVPSIFNYTNFFFLDMLPLWNAKQ
jgi:hypothetical protein